MTVPLPELCLREVFGFLAGDENESNLSRKQNIFSCILTNRYWCQTAVSFLWSDPFSINLRPEKAELLVDTYVANFSHKELEVLNISHFESYAPPTFDYVVFVRTLVVSGMIETTSRWLRRKAITTEECPIIDTLSQHILRRASNVKHIVSNSLLNLFSVSDATNFMNLTELTGFGEGAPGIYASAAEVAKNIRVLRFSLTNNYSVTPTTVNDIASLVQAQNRLERFSVDNKLGCNCCSLFALDLKKVFDAFVVSYTTLSVVELYDINFFSSFPFRQLSKCKNLSALEITRCYNFGPDITLYNDMDPTSFAHLRKISIFYSGMPSKILRILLTQAGHSLRQLKLVESESTENHFPEIVQSCITHNSNVTHFLVPIHPREISLLPSFLNSCVRLEHFEIWYKNSHEFDLEEVLPDIGISLPPNLKIFNVNMNWLFTPESFGEFLNNCGANIEYMGFPLCIKFSSGHMEKVIEHLKHPLKWLNICNADKNIGNEVIKKMIFTGLVNNVEFDDNIYWEKDVKWYVIIWQ